MFRLAFNVFVISIGFLYLYLMQYKNWSRNLLIIASILPIAFLANLIRVITLILVTYYYGDEVGQGFVHKFAGMLLFATSLMFIFLFDSVIGKLSFLKTSNPLKLFLTQYEKTISIRHLVIGLSMLCTAGLAVAMKPHHYFRRSI